MSSRLRPIRYMSVTRQPNRFCATALRQYGAIHKQPWAQAHRADLCFVMPRDRASREPRAGIADAALNTILQLAPMRRRCAKLLPHEMVDPRFAKRNRVLFSGHSFHGIGDLPAAFASDRSFPSSRESAVIYPLDILRTYNEHCVICSAQRVYRLPCLRSWSR